MEMDHYGQNFAETIEKYGYQRKINSQMLKIFANPYTFRKTLFKLLHNLKAKGGILNILLIQIERLFLSGNSFN